MEVRSAMHEASVGEKTGLRVSDVTILRAQGVL